MHIICFIGSRESHKVYVFKRLQSEIDSGDNIYNDNFKHLKDLFASKESLFDEVKRIFDITNGSQRSTRSSPSKETGKYHIK